MLLSYDVCEAKERRLQPCCAPKLRMRLKKPGVKDNFLLLVVSK